MIQYIHRDTQRWHGMPFATHIHIEIISRNLRKYLTVTQKCRAGLTVWILYVAHTDNRTPHHRHHRHHRQWAHARSAFFLRWTRPCQNDTKYKYSYREKIHVRSSTFTILVDLVFCSYGCWCCFTFLCMAERSSMRCRMCVPSCWSAHCRWQLADCDGVSGEQTPTIIAMAYC